MHQSLYPVFMSLLVVMMQVWARDYSAEDPGRCDCDTLQEALGMINGARRMVRSLHISLHRRSGPASTRVWRSVLLIVHICSNCKTAATASSVPLLC